MLSINAFKIIVPYVYTTSIDLTDAFFFYTCTFYTSISKIYILSFISIIGCMSNEYGPAIRVFTKISEVPVGHLKSLGPNSVVYVDDSYI